ncbi:MAG TPA: NAD(P)/FAD-dependent oxidoreductase [Pseudacidobacterium sp.]|nr:NAD(P)/FAD-dependent oxidoreductase [Pseudacidobacterium sp.]
MNDDTSLLIGSKHKHPLHAVVIGSGPNGLSAAIVLAQAGWQVDVYEAQPTIGGASRTLPLTLPGFQHDFGSAIHAMAAGSPFFSTLPLAKHGLEWVHAPAPLAHPFDDGTAITLERDLDDAERVFGSDGKRWRSIFGPLAEHWNQIAKGALRPLVHFPAHPFLMARFGTFSLMSAQFFADRFLQSSRVRALFAGIAAHSIMPLDAPLSASGGVMLAAAAHAVGWPMPRGGAQSTANALAGYFSSLGGSIYTHSPITSLEDFSPHTVLVCDISPRQLLDLASHRLTGQFQKDLRRFRYGPGAFKLDYALSAPIPWKAAECARAGTVHLGGTMEEIAEAELAVWQNRHPDRPFVLLTQPTLFDPSRAPEGKHIAWAYCHVPNGSTFDMSERIEAQIERFAPGFRDCILARHVSSPSFLETLDANLIGGDINGGAISLRQLVFRPTPRHYATSDPNIFLCSASTPPLGGVHGMCGYHAAQAVIRHVRHRL